MIDVPDAYLLSDLVAPATVTGRGYNEPVVVGLDLQVGVQVRLEVAPPVPVDIVVSAPAGSGVLFSATPDTAGSESLVVATGFASTTTPGVVLRPGHDPR